MSTPLRYEGAVYCREAVPDYDEGQGADGLRLIETYNRLEACGKYKQAQERYKRAYAKDRERVKGGRGGGSLYITGKTNEGRDLSAEEKAAKGRWWRTHYPPPVILEGLRDGGGSDDEGSVGGSLSVAGLAGDVSGAESAAVAGEFGTVSSDESGAEANGDVGAGGAGPPAKEYRRDVAAYGREENPTDSGVAPPEGVEALSMEALLLAGGWAFDNALHVKTGRVKIKDAPKSVSGAWLMVEWAQTDFKGFCAFYIDKLKAWHDKKLAEEQAEMKKRAEDDFDLFDLCDELEKAGAPEGA